ncbi:MAG: hypothetical protein WBI41_08290, partial [Azovibrio sp.]
MNQRHGTVELFAALKVAAGGIQNTANACIDSVRQVKGKPPKLEQHDYIGSRPLAPAEVAEAVRSHWGIENPLQSAALGTRCHPEG